MYHAIELTLLILPTPWERDKNATSIGKGANRGAGSIPCVDQSTVERDTSGHAAEHQQVGLPCLKYCSITC